MVDFVEFGDPAALRAVLTAQSAVLLEPVQAEGGVRLPPDGYLRQVRQACTEAGAVMILDEIQSGMGRLGAWWGADLAGVTPDVLLTGKILGGGVMPVGGVVASAQLFAPLNADPLLHSSTFAGSPLAAAAVTATIGAIKSEGLIERARELGPQVRDLAADAVTAHCPHLVTEVRGEGLLIGVDFVSADAATEFLIGLLDEHVIPSYSLNSSNVLRLTPPAILDAADLDWLGRALTSAAKHVSRVMPARRLTSVDSTVSCTAAFLKEIRNAHRLPPATRAAQASERRVRNARRLRAVSGTQRRRPERRRHRGVREPHRVALGGHLPGWPAALDRGGHVRPRRPDASRSASSRATSPSSTAHGSASDAAQGSEIVFSARLDMGIPSLADALEPIAVRTLIDNIASIVRGLVGSAELVASDVAVPAGSGS